jgi:hypothetical protein
MKLVVAALLATPGVAVAAEVASGLEVGYGRRLGEGAEGLSLLGLRGDVLFGREERDDFAGGLHVGVSLPDPLHEVQGDGGASILVPAIDGAPIVLSVGGFLGSGVARGGILGRVFWGARAKNDFGTYVATIGIFVEARAALAGADAVDVAIGVHVDGYTLLLPFVVLYESIRGGPP